MKYVIKDLMKEFEDLGCRIDEHGRRIIPYDPGSLTIAENSRSMARYRQEYVEKLKTATPEQRVVLQSEYNAKQQELSDENIELEYQNKSNKAYSIYDLIKLAEQLDKMGIDVSEEISKDDLEKLFVLLGGRISETGYEIPETPDEIKKLEEEIKILDHKRDELADPFSLYDGDDEKFAQNIIALNHKIDKLSDELDEEIFKHPEYLKLKTVLDTIEAMDELERYNSMQKTKGE